MIFRRYPQVRILLLLILVLALALAGCKSKEPDETPGTDTPPISPSTTQPTETYSPAPTPPSYNTPSDTPEPDPGPQLEPGQELLDRVYELMAVGDGVNVRLGPGTDHGIITSLSAGQKVETSEKMYNWYKVTVVATKEEGYIRDDLLIPYSENIEYIKFDTPRQLMSLHNGVNVRSGPGTDYEPVTTLSLGQRVETSEQLNGWYRVTVYPGLQEGYVNNAMLTPYDEDAEFYAADIVETVNGLASHLVDVRKYLPEVDVKMIMATPGNVTGTPQYSRDACMLQLDFIDRLQQAVELFAADGFKIVIYDAYRPAAVSGAMYDIIRDSRYVAPAGSSAHNRAVAVDMSLIEIASGEELEMPSPMHTMNETSHRSYSKMTPEARANMDYMAAIMAQCGFTTVTTEWWHFQEPDRYPYPVLDIPISALIYEQAN